MQIRSKLQAKKKSFQEKWNKNGKSAYYGREENEMGKNLKEDM